MYIIALVGPFGAGKSTVGINLAAFLAKTGLEPKQVAFVINEAGGATEITTPHAEVYTLPNGCFTCQDEAVLQDAIKEFDEQDIEVVIMEGFGIVSGDETKAFLEKVPYPHTIVGILDAANWNRNLINYSELLSTHLSVADTILATKQDTETLAHPVQEFLASHQIHTPITRAKVDQFPSEVWPHLEAALKTRMSHSHPHHEHDHGHHHHEHDHGHHHHEHDHGHHHHEHDHGHHHHEHDHGHHPHEHDHGHHHHEHDHGHHHHHHDDSHGWQTTVLELKPNTTLTELQSVTQAMVSDGKLRLKGRMQGTTFNVAPGATDWQLGSAEETTDLVICYLANGHDWPVDLLNKVTSPPETARGHQLLRVDTNLSATEAVLTHGLATLQSWSPQTHTLPDGKVQLITHPEELQIWKEMARRPGVKDAWFEQTITACLEYWVKCAEYLNAHKTDIHSAHLPTHQRELGVSLSWWTLEFAPNLPESFRQRVYQTEPAVMVAEGLRDLSALRADGFWRYWQGLEYLRGLRFGFNELSEANQAAVKVIAQNVVNFAKTDNERSAFIAEFSPEDLSPKSPTTTIIQKVTPLVSSNSPTKAEPTASPKPSQLESE